MNLPAFPMAKVLDREKLVYFTVESMRSFSPSFIERMLYDLDPEVILKQNDELAFDCIGFSTDFSSIPRSVSMNTEARHIQKIGGTSLSNSQFFILFEYK